MATPGVFTYLLKDRGDETNFESDDTGFRVALNAAGNAELVTRQTAVINGVTGSFDDKIKLNYYFDIPEAAVEEGAYVTISQGPSEPTVVVLPNKKDYVEGKGYKCSIPLAAKKASDTITAKVFDSQGYAFKITGNVRGDDYTENGVQYSLMQYFDWLEKNGTSDTDKAVGAAAKDYCSAAQIYFDYHAEGLTLSGAVDTVTSEMLSGYMAGRKGTLPGSVSIKGITAMLESDNTLRLYYDFKNNDPAGLTFAIDGRTVNLKQRSDGLYYLALDSGVFSNHLQDIHTYSVSDGTDTYEITASVLTYARSCAIKSDKTMSDLGKALYLYNRAAAAAFGN